MEKIITLFYLALILFLFSCNYTPPITENGKIKTGSIASLEKIKLGNLEQWVLIRGQNSLNPILLFIHGGPGTSEMALVKYYNADLEKHFTVVNWDQRGAGKTYSRNIPIESFNIKQITSDMNELIEILKKRFNQQKIFLVAHSWGTILAIYEINEHPESFYAYIGIGQVVDVNKNEKILYDYLLEEADKKKDLFSINTLKKIGSPINGTFQSGTSSLLAIDPILTKYHAYLYKDDNFNDFINIFIKSNEYSLKDLLNYQLSYKTSLDKLWPEAASINFLNEIIEFKIPVYFCVGKHDYATPFMLVEEYYNKIKAPKKELIWFENSSHFPIYEESKKFNNLLINKILSNSSL